jgi:hypothetical protein
MVLGRSDSDSIKRMLQYSLMYPSKADSSEAIVQNFHTFRQALNVASADQRVLVLVNAPAETEEKLRDSLRAVSNDPFVIGRFHFDFDQGDEWKKGIEGTNEEPSIVLINPGEFGLTGKVMKQLPLTASTQEILSALRDANELYAKTTEKKVYSTHVAKGRSQGVYFEGAVPYGEDRDGDGEIDRKGGGRGKGSRGGSSGRR